MASHGCYLCLLLFSVILIEPSEAGCMDYFTKKGLANALGQLPENIPVKIMNKPEDIVVCSLTKEKDCAEAEETCFLRECFKDYKPTCNETEESISVPFYHFMCLTNIAKRLQDTTKPPEVCEVYKKVCGEDSATPAPPTPSPTTQTIEATPSTPLPTTPTGLPTTPTGLPTTPTIKATPSTAPTIDATSSTAPTIEATSSTAPAIEATPTIEVTTKNPSTASTTKTTTASTTSSTTSTTAASFLVNSHQKSCPQEGICSEKETGSDIQKILIGVLITTNFIIPMAVYLYMRKIQQIPNLREEVRKTEIQQNTFPRDVEEGSILLTTPESSIIINSPENTII